MKIKEDDIIICSFSLFSELVVDVEIRLAAGFPVVRRVGEGEKVGAEVVLEDEDLVVSLVEERPGDVERLLWSGSVVTTHVEPVDKEGPVFPVLTGGTVVVEEGVGGVRGAGRWRLRQTENSPEESRPGLPVVLRPVGPPGEAGRGQTVRPELQGDVFPVQQGPAVQQDLALPQTFLLLEVVRGSEVGPPEVLHHEVQGAAGLAVLQVVLQLEGGVPQSPAAEGSAQVGQVIDGRVDLDSVDHELDEVPGVTSQGDHHPSLQTDCLPVDDVAVALPVTPVDVQFLHGQRLVAGLSEFGWDIFYDVPVWDELRHLHIRILGWRGAGWQLRMSEDVVERIVAGDHLPGGVVLGRVLPAL